MGTQKRAPLGTKKQATRQTKEVVKTKMADSADKARQGASKINENKNIKTTHEELDPSSLPPMFEQPTHHDYDKDDDGSQLNNDSIRIEPPSTSRTVKQYLDVQETDTE